ncbi:MAG TPA: hypothetical protein VHM70_13970 [Polyangiaceae bacterium]|jgi:hypothetical protein|nr:hypothetical protein [Polyangiaceae bacterium]
MGQLSKKGSNNSSFGLRSMAAVCLVALAGLTISKVASAQGAPPAGGGDGEGYGYEFEDDPLNAGGFGPNDATIRVRPKAARTTLIRPRTTFVPEMLKSVENL